MTGPAFWRLPPSALPAALQTPDGGLTSQQAAQWRLHYGGTDSERVLSLAWLNSHFESGLKSPLDEAILAPKTIDGSLWRKLDEVLFDFERRRVSVLLERAGVRTLIVKGAPEEVIRISTQVETAGVAVFLDPPKASAGAAVLPRGAAGEITRDHGAEAPGRHRGIPGQRRTSSCWTRTWAWCAKP